MDKFYNDNINWLNRLTIAIPNIFEEYKITLQTAEENINRYRQEYQVQLKVENDLGLQYQTLLQRQQEEKKLLDDCVNRINVILPRELKNLELKNLELQQSRVQCETEFNEYVKGLPTLSRRINDEVNLSAQQLQACLLRMKQFPSS